MFFTLTGWCQKRISEYPNTVNPNEDWMLILASTNTVPATNWNFKLTNLGLWLSNRISGEMIFTNITIINEFTSITTNFNITNFYFNNTYITNINQGSINPTIGYVPYNVDGVNFADTPFFRNATNTITLTNQYGFISKLVVAGTGSVANVSLVTSSSGSAISSGGTLALASAANSSLTLNEGVNQLFWIDKHLYGASNTFFLGGWNVPYSGVYAVTNFIMASDGTTNAYTDNGSSFLRNGVPVGTVINSTDGRIPVRANSTTLTNSPFVVLDTNSVGINGSTNVLTRGGANLTHLLYTNGSSQVYVLVQAGDSTDQAAFGVSSGNAQVRSGTSGNRSVQLLPDGGIGNYVTVATNTVTPSASNSVDLATAALPFRTAFVQTAQIHGQTNQVIFGATNTAPVSAVSPSKWISVQVEGDAGIYRLPLYE